MGNWIRLRHSGDLIDLGGVYHVQESKGGRLLLWYRHDFEPVEVCSKDAQQVKSSFDYKIDDEWGPDDVATLPPEAVRQIVACRDGCGRVTPTVAPAEGDCEKECCEAGEKAFLEGAQAWADWNMAAMSFGDDDGEATS
jgi:hypothetical protein